MRHHKRERAFGPSPANNYTTGSTGRRRFWQRNHNKRNAALAGGALAAHEKRHPDSLPTHSTPADVRTSYQTDNTAVGTEPIAHHKYGQEAVADEYRTPTTAVPGTGYHHANQYQTTGTTNNGEIPAREYMPNSVHNANTHY